MKICRRCGEEKPLELFPVSKGRRQHICGHCKNTHRRPVTDAELAHMRGLVGVGPDGPTQEQLDYWRAQERQFEEARW